MVSTDRVSQRSSHDALPLTPAPTPGMARITYHVGGLTCASDAARLEHLIQSVPGVIEVVVNPISEIAYITVDSARTTPGAIARRIDATPYGPATR